MKPPATIADVAAASGVSRATVSLVLNGRPGPSAATAERVREVASDLGYRPDVRARRLRGARSHCVALLTTVPEALAGERSGYSFQIALAVPLSRLLLARGYSMLLVPPLTDTAQLDNVDMDAAIIVEPRRGEPLSRDLEARGVVTVSVGDAPGLTVDAVVDRGASGADAALAHLVDRGARSIGVLLASEGSSVSVNVRDYLDTHSGSLPAAAVTTVVEAPAGGGEEAGRVVARELLSGRSASGPVSGPGPGPAVDAVYAPTDVLALGVLAAARELGLVVPGDLMVVTNFNGPRAMEADPPLTSLDLDMEQIAGACVDLIQDLLDGQGPGGSTGAVGGVPRRVIPTPTVVSRESTAR